MRNLIQIKTFHPLILIISVMNKLLYGVTIVVPGEEWDHDRNSHLPLRRK